MRKLMAMCLVVGMAAVAAPTTATGGGHNRLPSTIDLPDEFFPEGIASGRGSSFYVGSLNDGTIYKGNYLTGEGEVLTDPVGPFATIGLNVDRWGRVWAAGGTSGQGRVFDGRTGELLAQYQFTAPLESFINDVIVTRDAAWFTDSGTQISPDPANFQFAGEPRLFKVPMWNGGRLQPPDRVVELPVAMPDIGFPNLNGIETAPNNRTLIVAHNVEGTLYRVNPNDGSAAVVDVDQTFAGPDGLLRRGKTLYVVEPGATRVTTVELDRRGTRGDVIRQVIVPDAESPTTAALHRRGLYVADAKFFTQTGPYKITRLPLMCRKIKTTGEGNGVAPLPGDPEGLVRTEADIRGGPLRGTTEAAFQITGETPTGFAFEGELTFTTSKGTLTLALAGTLDVSTGEFESTGPITGGTGRFDGAVGSLSLDGVQDLTDPAGSFTETVTGEICGDHVR